MSARECLRPEFVYCELADKRKQRKSNEHHLYFPKNRYTTPLEVAFRELEINKVQMCVCDHNYLHETTYPPKKPSVGEMCVALTVWINNEV